MDTPPPAARPPLTVDQLIALAPRFGAWLDEHAVPPDQRATFLREDWAAQFYAEAVVAGAAADLGPFLAALDAEVLALKALYGTHFIKVLVRSLFAAKADSWYAGQALVFALTDVLPPTLLLCLHEWYAWEEYDSRHDTWSYGVSSGAAMPPFGSGY